MAQVICTVDTRATVSRTSAVREAELNQALQIFDGVRCGTGYEDGSGIRLTNDTPSSAYNTVELDYNINALYQKKWMYILGTSAPLWANWYNALGASSFQESARPPVALWAQQATDYTWLINYIANAYSALGVDSATNVYYQLTAEPGHKYVGDGRITGTTNYASPYSGLTNGTWDRFADVGARNLIDQLNYMAANISFGDHKVIAPPIGCTPAYTAREIATFNDTYIDRCDYLSLDCYLSTSLLNAVDDDKYINEYYDRVMYCCDAIAGAVSVSNRTKLFVLAEMGGNFTQQQLNSSAPTTRYGFGKSGERLVKVREKCINSGRFVWINQYCFWERDAGVADSATFAMVAHDATTYNARYRAFARAAGKVATLPPLGTYYKATGEIWA